MRECHRCAGSPPVAGVFVGSPGGHGSQPQQRRPQPLLERAGRAERRAAPRSFLAAPETLRRTTMFRVSPPPSPRRRPARSTLAARECPTRPPQRAGSAAWCRSDDLCAPPLHWLRPAAPTLAARAGPPPGAAQGRDLRGSRGAIDPVAETFKLEGYLRTSWNDPRLAFNVTAGNRHKFSDASWVPTWWDDADPTQANIKMDYVAHDEMIHMMWDPVVFAANSVNERGLENTAGLVNIAADGTVRRSVRIVDVLSSRFNFRWFPYDRQELIIDLQLYSLSVDDVMMQWLSQPAAGSTEVTQCLHAVDATGAFPAPSEWNLEPPQFTSGDDITFSSGLTSRACSSPSPPCGKAICGVSASPAQPFAPCPSDPARRRVRRALVHPALHLHRAALLHGTAAGANDRDEIGNARHRSAVAGHAPRFAHELHAVNRLPHVVRFLARNPARCLL